MKHISLALGILLCIFLAGCKSSPNVVGKWKAQVDASKIDDKNPGAALAKQMADSMTLEIKSDKTFSLTMFLPFEGTWTQSGDTLTLTMTKAMGQDVSKMPNRDSSQDKPLVLKISPDGSKLSGEDPSGKETLTFVRA